MNHPKHAFAGPIGFPLRDQVFKSRPETVQIVVLSLVIGLMLLAPSVFMFEVYGRVLNSRNIETLGWLLLAAVGTYVVVELLELVRWRALRMISNEVASSLSDRLVDATFTAALTRQPGGGGQALADLKTVTEFIRSPAIGAALDLPASLLYLLLLSLLSPWLGLLALAIASMLAAIGLWQERRSAMPYGQATRAGAEAQLRAVGLLRNAQVIEAMGMGRQMHERWEVVQRRLQHALSTASDRAGATIATSKLLNLLQGSLLLGLAVWLALGNDLWGGAGMAIVASILGGRVLAPLVVLVSQWRAIGSARVGYQRLQEFMRGLPGPQVGMELPAPKGHLVAEHVLAVAPGTDFQILKGISFEAPPGHMVAIIGPTGSGKTTLARLLVGVWPSQGGKVRLDGADVYEWHKSQLGPYVGYVPQGVELFDGTVAENIARFDSVDMAKVRQAADDAGVTAIIEALPDRFDTRIGDGGVVLSGGQRQRIALARAVYGNPKLLLLDEPNSNLDEAGDHALMQLIQLMKSRKCTVIGITHRTQLLAAADFVLLMQEGGVAKYGPRDEVLAALKAANERATSRVASRALPSVMAPGSGPQPAAAAGAPA